MRENFQLALNKVIIDIRGFDCKQKVIDAFSYKSEPKNVRELEIFIFFDSEDELRQVIEGLVVIVYSHTETDRLGEVLSELKRDGFLMYSVGSTVSKVEVEAVKVDEFFEGEPEGGVFGRWFFEVVGGGLLERIKFAGEGISDLFERDFHKNSELIIIS